MSFAVVFAVVLVAALAIIFMRRRIPSRITVSSPRLGFLNLKGPVAHELLISDKSALAPLFRECEDATVEPPQCHVLFLYCDVLADGRISATEASLRELIHCSGASIVVLATDNPSDGFRAATSDTTAGRANLVMTMQRNDPAFAMFYQRLFKQMFAGVTMPSAWVALAPQVPGQDHLDCPSSVFLCERGQLTFA